MGPVAQLAVLLVAVLLGATVALLVARITQEHSESQLNFSKEMMTLALQSLNSTEREAERERSLKELVAETEKLNVVVGNLYLASRSSERTVLTRPMQVGEVPPGTSAVRVSRENPPLPPEGLAPQGPTTAAQQTRASAFAVPT